MRKLVTESGHAFGIHELDDDTAMMLQGFKVTEKIITEGEESKLIERKTEFKLIDRNKASELLGRSEADFIYKLGVGGIDSEGEITEIPIVFVPGPKREDDE